MCLILIAYKTHPDYRLVLAANRDEFYARPSAALDFWPDAPDLLAGRDLQQAGTWMGITRSGRLAAITNYRDGQPPASAAPSRGHLVADFLLGKADPRSYLEMVLSVSMRYHGFNLLVGDSRDLFYLSNRNPGIHAVAPGIHGLSNHLLNTAWPKVQRGIDHLSTIVQGNDRLNTSSLTAVLTDQRPVSDDRLPQTGVDLAKERMLAPIFITSPIYGTRSSSVLLVDAHGGVTFQEQTWHPAQPKPSPAGNRSIQFRIDGHPF